MSDPTPLPSFIEGYGEIRAFAQAATPPSFVKRSGTSFHPTARPRDKLLSNLDEALGACDVRDGATLSFHHHLRNGDHVLNLVLEAASRRGLRNLTIAPSSLFPVHAPLVEHIRTGVVSRIVTSYVSGPVAAAISNAMLSTPAVLQTHGGRARAIEEGSLRIDATFVAAPCADRLGNLNGIDGPAACGPLGYAMVDVQHARHVVAVTDHLAGHPICPVDIEQDRVDFVVKVASIGDPQGILSGTTRPTTDPTGLAIAEAAARVIDASGLLIDDFSFQTGAGGISLAVADALRKIMHQKGTEGSFAAGGVTGFLCKMLDEKLFRSILDVQCFDLAAVESYRRDSRHRSMSASLYASPHSRGAVVDALDVMVLGAAEIDLAFNVNVTTGSDGVLLGGSGGHADTAAGAKLALVTTRLTTGKVAKVVDRVSSVTTPGSTIDVVVTEFGVSVNPSRPDLRDRLRAAHIATVPIEAQRDAAETLAPSTPRVRSDGPIVAVLEYRDGSVIDVVRALH